MTTYLIKEIERYPRWAEENVSKQINRYKGWMLISTAAAKELKCEAGSKFLFEQGFMFIDWSSLSGDQDDIGDIAISKF